MWGGGHTDGVHNNKTGINSVNIVEDPAHWKTEMKKLLPEQKNTKINLKNKKYLIYAVLFRVITDLKHHVN